MSAEDINDDSQPQGDDASAAEMAETLSSGGDENFVVTEEKKPVNRTTLVLFLVVALGGGALYLMHLRTGPKTADAAPQAAQANQTITQFLSGGGSNLKNMEQMLQNTQKIVQQFLAYPSVNQIPLNQLQTNPFRLTASKDGESSSEAEARKKQDEEKVSIRRAAEALQIQSIMFGARKACMINNTMYTEGQQVEGFTVEKINPNSVIVKNSGYRFEIKAQK